MNWNIIFALLAAGAGASIAMQASANGAFRRNLEDHWWAAFFSICGTFVTAAVGMIVLRPNAPSAEAIRSTQWWNWIGGPLGAMIVLAGAALTTRLGAAPFIALVVAGQLLCSVLLDHFAFLGLPQQSISPGRVLGALLVIAGVICIKYL